MSDNAARAASSLADLKDLMSGVSAAPSARGLGLSTAGAPACNDADQVFIFAYLVPEFWKLTDARPGDIAAAEVSPFIDQSTPFAVCFGRTCHAARRAGTGALMQAGGPTASHVSAGLARCVTIPYLPRIASDINRFFERAGEYISTCGSINGGTRTYYVVAENIANIRSCASTSCAITSTAHRGQRLDVVDDNSNWYEIVLPSCETAFIAGFLASQTPPDA